jgi:hypothetical protein
MTAHAVPWQNYGKENLSVQPILFYLSWFAGIGISARGSRYQSFDPYCSQIEYLIFIYNATNLVSRKVSGWSA